MYEYPAIYDAFYFLGSMIAIYHYNVDELKVDGSKREHVFVVSLQFIVWSL